jgi:hypothetical protein
MAQFNGLTRKVFRSAAALIALSLSVAAQTGGARADQTTCNLTQGFSLLKLRENAQPGSTTSWQVLYRGRLAYDINRQELGGIYGGYPDHGGNPPIDCSGIVVGEDFFAFQMGWQGDLLMAFGIEKGSSGPQGLRILRYFPHDYGFALSASQNELLAVYGWKHDLNARLCWSPRNDNHWWHNADHRAGMGACVSSAWPWTYPISGEQEVSFE